VNPALLCLAATIAALVLAHTAAAQEEFPPPSGKGRVVVVIARGYTSYG
jgi:hypothetical protein